MLRYTHQRAQFTQLSNFMPSKLSFVHYKYASNKQRALAIIGPNERTNERTNSLIWPTVSVDERRRRRRMDYS